MLLLAKGFSDHYLFDEVIDSLFWQSEIRRSEFSTFWIFDVLNFRRSEFSTK
jgi:hypothetical protein